MSEGQGPTRIERLEAVLAKLRNRLSGHLSSACKSSTCVCDLVEIEDLIGPAPATFTGKALKPIEAYTLRYGGWMDSKTGLTCLSHRTNNCPRCERKCLSHGGFPRPEGDPPPKPPEDT